MRIISGKYKGRRLTPPSNLEVRPTTDKAKEGLFNILMTYDFEHAAILDLFAGTGSMSYEFLSRGSERVTAVEQDRKCIQYITEVAERMEFENFSIKQTNVFKYIDLITETYDIIFADPPYDLDEIESLPELIFTNKLLNGRGLFILEHDSGHDFSHDKHLDDKRKYGKVHFSIFKNNDFHAV